MQHERIARRIAIVGGGAGGLELAIRLARATAPTRRAEVTLIDCNLSHIWKPRWHELAVGLLVAAEEEADYAVQAMRHGFAFELGEVLGIDLERREIEVSAVSFPSDDVVASQREGDLLPPRTLTYDIAVLAMGSIVNDFSTPGVREHAYMLDTAQASERLHRAILAQATRVKAGLSPAMHVLIVGAGTTGVEFAAELQTAVRTLASYRSLIAPEQLTVTLVEAADRALPGSPQSLSHYAARILQAHDVDLRLRTKVTAITSSSATLATGECVETDLVVWTSGIKAGRLATDLAGVRRKPGGRIEVDSALRIVGDDGEPRHDVYGVGDCVAVPSGSSGEPVVATAQAAHQQAQHLARSLCRQLRGGAALPFRYRDKGTLVSLGEDATAGEFPSHGRGDGLRITGRPARLAYAGLYRAHLAELLGLRSAAAVSLSALIRRSARPSVKLPW